MTASPELIALIAAAFLAGGFVKGLVGTGLPTLALGLLVLAVDLKTAIALMVVPALLTNLVQALKGGAFRTLVHRLRTMLLTLIVGVVIGTSILAVARSDMLVIGLGGVLIVYGALGVSAIRLPSPGPGERWQSPLVGLVSGLIAGTTGTLNVPSALYLQALGLSRDRLIQAMGIVFGTGSIVLLVTLTGRSLLTPTLALLSLAGLPTALIGQALGGRVRRHLDEAMFLRVFFVSLAVIGIALIVRTLLFG
ncbi:MAG: sulfite exporter TauE/SafE family protein [Pseudomonadota bacterium]